MYLSIQSLIGRYYGYGCANENSSGAKGLLHIILEALMSITIVVKLCNMSC